jgi:hypothetical protein
VHSTELWVCSGCGCWPTGAVGAIGTYAPWLRASRKKANLPLLPLAACGFHGLGGGLIGTGEERGGRGFLTRSLRANSPVMTPVTMVTMAAYVQTTTARPSFMPRFCVKMPREENSICTRTERGRCHDCVRPSSTFAAHPTL